MASGILKEIAKNVPGRGRGQEHQSIEKLLLPNQSLLSKMKHQLFNVEAQVMNNNESSLCRPKANKVCQYVTMVRHDPPVHNDVNKFLIDRRVSSTTPIIERLQHQSERND
jgi:hypothetical protein